MKNDDKQRGFTLIELLVVISIIAILASMLLPAFQDAMGRVKASNCQSNLRQVATACRLYAMDHNGWYPLLPILDRGESVEALYPTYIEDTRNFYCPGDRDEAPLTGRIPSALKEAEDVAALIDLILRDDYFDWVDDRPDKGIFTSYFYLGMEHSAGKPMALGCSGGKFHRLTPLRMGSPAGCIVAMDLPQFNDVVGQSVELSSETEGLTPLAAAMKGANHCNHKNGGNVAYADGSVRFRTIGSFPYVLEEMEVPGQILGMWIFADEVRPFPD